MKSTDWVALAIPLIALVIVVTLLVMAYGVGRADEKARRAYREWRSRS